MPCAHDATARYGFGKDEGKMSREDLTELARWIDSVNDCVSQAERDQFYFGALRYFMEEFEKENEKTCTEIR